MRAEREGRDGQRPGTILEQNPALAASNRRDPSGIIKLAPDTLPLMRVGKNPLIVKKLRYYVDKEFTLLAQLAPYRWVLPDKSEAESDRLSYAFRTQNLPAPVCVVRTSSSVFMASVLKDSD